MWGFENQWDFNVFMTDMEILHIPSFRGSDIMHRFFGFLDGLGALFYLGYGDHVFRTLAVAIAGLTPRYLDGVPYKHQDVVLPGKFLCNPGEFCL